jgi:hypothetical protein
MTTLAGCIIIALALGFVVEAINRASQSGKHQADAAYWRNAYETLVKQSGRDLNDGLGRDERSLKA